jgi:hypothetical protein
VRRSVERSRPWYRERKGEADRALVATFRTIRDETAYQRDADEYHMALYGGEFAAQGVRRRSLKSFGYAPAREPHNLCRSAVDTMLAKVAKLRPMPEVLAQHGDWKALQRAKRLSQFLEGAFHKARIYQRWAKLTVRDALILGRAHLSVADVGERVVCERVYPWELYEDPWDAHYNDARNRYRVRSFDVGVLEKRWAAAKRKGLGAASLLVDDGDTYSDSTTDRVDVLEAWHLPSEPGADDGRYVVAIEGATLVDEPWEDETFPFADLYYSDPLTGNMGQGLVELLEGYQYDTNVADEQIRASMKMLGGTLIISDDRSRVTDVEFRSGVGGIIHTSGVGAPPTLFQPAPVHPQVYQRPRDLRDDAYASAGISQMSAAGTKPPGVDAAVALRMLDDIDTERHVVFARAYETWNVDVAALMIRAVKRIAERVGDYRVDVTMPGRSGLIPMQWREVELDGYELREFPASMIPHLPAARMQFLKELRDEGDISRKTFIRQIHGLDVDGEMDLETAHEALVEEQLTKMADTDADVPLVEAYIPPPTQVDLEFAARRTQQMMSKLEREGAPEEVMARFRQYRAGVEDLIQRAAPPPAPPAPAPMPDAPPQPVAA